VGGHFVDWARQRFWPAHGATLTSIFAALAIAVVLAGLLGGQAVLLSMIAICIPQLAMFLSKGTARPQPILQGIALCTLPFLLGCGLFKLLALEDFVVAVGLGVACGGVLTSQSKHWALHVGQGMVLLLMVLTRRPIGAFLVALFWVPHLLRFRFITRDSLWWLLASTLAAGVALS
jgi:hypothetical protein